MSGLKSDTYARGLAMSAAGMIILSPDALLLRMVEHASIWDTLFYRSIFVFLALFFYLAVRNGRRVVDVFKGMGLPGLIATVLMTCSNVTFVMAIENTSVANTLVILATMPLFGALLGWLIIGERVGRRTRYSILLAFAGIVVIFSDSLGQGYWLGDALAMVTAFLMGLNLVTLRKFKGQDVVTPAYCLSGLIVALIAFPLANPAQVPSGDLGVLMVMGLIVVPLSMVLFLGGARHAPAAEIALLSLIETVLGPFWAWLGVGEPVATVTLVGGAIVILAIAGNALLGLRGDKRQAGTP